MMRCPNQQLEVMRFNLIFCNLCIYCYEVICITFPLLKILISEDYNWFSYDCCQSLQILSLYLLNNIQQSTHGLDMKNVFVFMYWTTILYWLYHCNYMIKYRNITDYRLSFDLDVRYILIIGLYSNYIDI